MVAFEPDDFVTAVYWMAAQQEKWYTAGRILTVESTDNRLLRRSLLYDDLDMWILRRKVLDAVVEIPAQVGRGRPDVTVLKDELAKLRDESGVSVCRS